MKNMVWVAVFLMTAMSAGVCSATEISNTSLHKLLVLSGIAKMTQQIPSLVRGGMEQGWRQAELRAEKDNKKPALSEGDFKVLESATVSAFRPSDILKAIATQVKHNISEQDARKMLVWYSSRIGKRINKAEENAGTLQAQQQLRATARQLLADKPLVQYAREMDQLLHSTDFIMKMQESNALAIYVAFSTAQHPDRPLHINMVRKKIDAAMQKARPRFELMATLYSVYAYKNIDMASLQKYLSFMETPRFLRFNKYANAGLLDGMHQAMGKLADAITTEDRRNHPRQLINDNDVI